MTVREQLRAAYLASGLTQEEIAYRAGVSQKTLVNILGGRNAEADNLLAVARALRIEAIIVPN